MTRAGARAAAVAVAVVLSAVAIAVAVGGCGGSGPRGASASSTPPATPRTSSTHSRTVGSTPSRTSPPRRAPAAVSGPPVGARQTVHTHGADLAVTIVRVADLAHTGSALLAGTRAVGVFVRIANDAGQTYDSTASGDFSLVVSGGQALPLLVRSGPCATPLVDIESMIVSGVVRTGCVGFSVPSAARVLGVRFSPHSRPLGTLSWRA